ncbi:hypothetical protein L2E82_40223 [Cichorium intybus]|uniref:Uncharacterized protein n=1 Tax=Cichorium intybus TaxID=13427 RepID=A0ACB9AKR5_CICIN|nr:hypothetical protein L2E82_40223 [Cichorium intybus]
MVIEIASGRAFNSRQFENQKDFSVSGLKLLVEEHLIPELKIEIAAGVVAFLWLYTSIQGQVLEGVVDVAKKRLKRTQVVQSLQRVEVKKSKYERGVTSKAKKLVSKKRKVVVDPEETESEAEVEVGAEDIPIDMFYISPLEINDDLDDNALLFV